MTSIQILIVELREIKNSHYFLDSWIKYFFFHEIFLTLEFGVPYFHVIRRVQQAIDILWSKV